MYQPYPGSETQLPETRRAPAPLAGPVKIWGVLVWLAGLVAVVLLWRRESGAYFRQAPA
jgi:hypothetical protein